MNTSMTALSDVYFKAYRDGGGGSPHYHIPSHEKALRAVAEAAIAADRAARAKPFGFVDCHAVHGYEFDKVRRCLYQCDEADGWTQVAVYTAPPAAPVVPEGMVLVPAEVIEFLHGAAPLDGVWFGDRHPTERGAFWWRKKLAAAPAPSQEPTP